MPAFAPRLPDRLKDAISAIDDPALSIGEVCRRTGARAEELGVPRPSYETVRVFVRELRSSRRAPTTADIVVDVAFRTRPPAAVLDHISGVGVPRR
jgi:hypothetical protein